MSAASDSVSAPIVKLLGGVNGGFYAVSGSQVFFHDGQETWTPCLTHPEGRRWSAVAALSADGSLFAVCDDNKRLFLHAVTDRVRFVPVSVPMHLAKTATSLTFSSFPTANTLLVADKFGDVLRFEAGEEFDRWARESGRNDKSLSIHTFKRVVGVIEGKGEREGGDEVVADNDEADNDEADNDHEGTTEPTGNKDADVGSEAHHCTIIGHISMVTDLQVLSLEGTEGGLIITADRDEKVRLSRADRPEIIHAFALGHRAFVGSVAVCDATRSFYSAGGDEYIVEWRMDRCDRDPYGQLRKTDTLTLPEGSAAVRTVKVNGEGNRLLVLLDSGTLLEYRKTGDASEWSRSATSSLTDIVALEQCPDGTVVTASWSAAEGASLARDGERVALPVSLDCVSPTEGNETLLLLSASRLRKDLDRMDWNQRKRRREE